MTFILSSTTYAACAKAGLLEPLPPHNRREDLVVRNVKADKLLEIRKIAEKVDDKRAVKAMDALIEIAAGTEPRLVPNYSALVAVMTNFLEKRFRRGFLYSRLSDDRVVAYLVKGVSFKEPGHNSRDDEMSCYMELAWHGWADPDRGGDPVARLLTKSIKLTPGDVTRRQPEKILESLGYLVETEELEALYDADLAKFKEQIETGFGRQFRFDGNPLDIAQGTTLKHRNGEDRIVAGRMILDQNELIPADGPKRVEVRIFGDHTEDDTLPSPVHPLCRLFDLKTHRTVYGHVRDVQPYVYRPELGKKLILPETHRDLLDVLTSDLDLLVDDIVEGKSANNLILCRGAPGVGKTLTAEIYSEIISKPLLVVNAGALGTTPVEIEKNLQQIFARARRWGCVVLLDEADVFVMERGTDLVQNAVVAVFLRALEYFSELFFLTTNRSNLIDDAIISRCLAIIDYAPPEGDLARDGWQMMTGHFGLDMQGQAIGELVKTFPAASLRDMKLLTRLAIKWARFKKGEADIGIFRKAAVFRGMLIAQPSGNARKDG